MFSALPLGEIIATIFYAFLGAGLMGLFWKIITKFSPFPIVKEIEEDQNLALSVLIGSVFISLAIIIAAVILS